MGEQNKLFKISTLIELHEAYSKRVHIDIESLLITNLIEELLLYKKTINSFNGGNLIGGSKMGRSDYVAPITTKEIQKIQLLMERGEE